MNLNLSALPPPFFYCSCISLIRRWLNRVLLECELWFGPSLCFHNNQDLWLPLKNYIIRLLPYEGSNIRPQESISYMNTTSARTNFEGNLGVKEIWWGLVKGETMMWDTDEKEKEMYLNRQKRMMYERNKSKILVDFLRIKDLDEFADKT